MTENDKKLMQDNINESLQKAAALNVIMGVEQRRLNILKKAQKWTFQQFELIFFHVFIDLLL